jgi:hypothetical protein
MLLLSGLMFLNVFGVLPIGGKREKGVKISSLAALFQDI